MKRSTMIIGVIVIIAGLIIAASYLGLIPSLASFNPFDNDGSSGNEDSPPGTIYCDYTDMQILDMLELVSGKDLNNQQGLAFVDALNMQACSQDDKTYTELVTHYKVEYIDWDLLGEQTYSGSGWDAETIVWGNDPTNPTSAKSIITGSGVSIKEYYGYNTMTITGSGTWVTYQAFALWLLAS